jgi:hypothetical protein
VAADREQQPSHPPRLLFSIRPLCSEQPRLHHSPLALLLRLPSANRLLLRPFRLLRKLQLSRQQLLLQCLSLLLHLL